MNSLYYFQLKKFLKSYHSIFVFIIPLILLLIIGRMWPLPWLFTAVIGVSITMVSFWLFGSSFYDLKEQSFMRQMGSTRLNKFTLLTSFVLFSSSIIILMCIWLLFWGWFLSVPVHYLTTTWNTLLPNRVLPPVGVNLIWSHIEWWTFIYAILATIMVSTIMAYFFFTFTRSHMTYNLVSVLYIFAFVFAGGNIPHTVMHKIFYIFPQYYTTSMMFGALNQGIMTQFAPYINNLQTLFPYNQYLMNLSNYYYYVIPWNWANLQSQAQFYAPYLFSIAMILGILAKFKWRTI